VPVVVDWRREGVGVEFMSDFSGMRDEEPGFDAAGVDNAPEPPEGPARDMDAVLRSKPRGGVMTEVLEWSRWLRDISANDCSSMSTSTMR